MVILVILGAILDLFGLYGVVETISEHTQPPQTDWQGRPIEPTPILADIFLVLLFVVPGTIFIVFGLS